MANLTVETHNTQADALARQAEVGGWISGPYQNVRAFQFDGEAPAFHSSRGWVLIFES